jgi:apolipoprotein N-acyltransferase
LLPASSGVLLTLCFPPFNIWPFVFVFLIPLLISIYYAGNKEEFCSFRDKKNFCLSKSALLKGFVAGFAFFFLLMWWVAPTISQYGNLPIYLSYPVVMILTGYLAVFFAIWAGFADFLLNHNNYKKNIYKILFLSALWVLLEWIRGHFLSGLPWGIIAYSLDKFPPFIQTAEIWSVYGISFFIIAFNLLIFFIIFDLNLSKKKKISYFAIILLFWVGLYFYGAYSVNKYSALFDKNRTIYAGAVQGAIPQDVKWDREFQWHTLDVYAKLSKNIRDNLPEEKIFLVYPETAMPFYLQEPTMLRQGIESIPGALNLYLLTGSPYYELDSNKKKNDRNSAFLFKPDRTVAGRHDKYHLVPFAEYIPFGSLLTWTRKFLPTAGDFISGDGVKPITADELKAGVLICFESIFPEISGELAAKGANIITIITNDAWFGKTGAPYQHEQFAVFRAIETRKWVIRSANTGISSIITPFGARTGQTELFKQDVVIAKICLMENKTIWAKYGDWIPLIFCVIIFIFSIIDFKRRSP